MRTRSRRESFADDLYASAGLLTLIQQLRSEPPPARVQHGFRQARANQFGAAHVAYDYLLVALHHAARKLMRGIRPTAPNLPMDPPGSLAVPSTLGLRKPLCVALTPATSFQSVPLAGHGHVLQSQIDANGLTRSDAGLHLHLYRQTEPPVSDGILHKAAVAPLRVAREPVVPRIALYMSSAPKDAVIDAVQRKSEGNGAEFDSFI